MRISRVALLIALVFPTLSFAQDDRSVMSIVDMLNVPSLSNPRLSPDGEAVVYEFAEADWKKNKQVGSIFLPK